MTNSSVIHLFPLQHFGVISLLILLLSSCGEQQNSSLFTVLNADQTGVTFANTLTESDSLNIIQYLYYYNGAGVAAGDLNNDDLPDLVFGSNQGSTALYLNNSTKEEIKFQDISLLSNAATNGWTTGVNLVDINADGWLDIFLCQVNHKSIEGQNRLLINQGLTNGIPTFEDETALYGLDFKGLSTQSAFFDYDRDGDLDMYLLNHSVHSAENYAPSNVREIMDENSGDKLYQNDDGFFVDVTEQAGIYSSKIGFGLGIGISDLNNDSYPDIYIGNDFHENDYLYINNGDGTFSERIGQATGHTSQFSMGLDIADINNDGHQDIVTLDMMPFDEVIKKSSVPSDNYNIYEFKHGFGYHYQLARNQLQLNSGQYKNGIPNYSEIGQLSGIEDTDWSWSSLLFDIDGDGNKDIFVSNGIVRRPNDLDYLNYLSNPLVQSQASDMEMASNMPSGSVPNKFFLQSDDLRFEGINHQVVGQTPSVSTGAAYADFDLDGDYDIVTNNINQVATIYQNTTTTNRRYTKLKLVGTDNNLGGVGAKIEVVLNGESQHFEINSTRGFMSSSGDLINISGSAEVIDEVKVTWPNGGLSSISDVKLEGQKMTINQKSAINQNQNQKQSESITTFIQADTYLDYTHFENQYNDQLTEKLMPWLLSTQGPAMAVADVNGDGREDLFMGGAKGQRSQLLIQEADGSFQTMADAAFNKSDPYEDVDALFFDADGDGDQDLYVVSGGNEYINDSPFLLDRVYINDGAGRFDRKLNALPLLTENGSSVSAGDFDKDGDLDLIVGSSVKTRSYGLSEGAWLLVNNGAGRFGNATRKLAPQLQKMGMIHDVAWADMDQDNDLDMVIVGHWMPIIIMTNNRGLFEINQVPNSIGLWNNVKIEDIDGDKRLDIVAGNFGQNTVLADNPGSGISIGDFNDDQLLDALIYYERDGVKNPIASRDQLIEQMNFFKNVHQNYAEYAQADFNQMFGSMANKRFSEVVLDEFRSCVFANRGGLNFSKKALPIEAQFAPVQAIEVADVDTDGQIDLLLGGNLYEIAPSIGRGDASHGLLIKGRGNFNFDAVASESSGISIKGQVRKIKRIGNSDRYIFSRNNEVPVIYKTAQSN